MALTSTKEYTDHRTVKDIYPGINGYSTKQRIYNFETTDTSNQYQANSTGLKKGKKGDSKWLQPLYIARTRNLNGFTLT